LAGYHSILVKTGVFKGENDEEHPAATVCENVIEAVDFIIKNK
jgi:ribonucleotide monophosphatase NagD (HAD superfamily)